MSLNSFVTPDGAEIGRAQAMQAAAAGIEPDARMNPVLLKPGGDTAHPRHRARAARRDEVERRRLPDAKPGPAGNGRPGQPRPTCGPTYDVVICEGAGSPAEINLRRHRHRQPVAGPGGRRSRSSWSATSTGAACSPPCTAPSPCWIRPTRPWSAASSSTSSGVTRRCWPRAGHARGLTGGPCSGCCPGARDSTCDVEDSLALDADAAAPGRGRSGASGRGRHPPGQRDPHTPDQQLHRRRRAGRRARGAGPLRDRARPSWPTPTSWSSPVPGPPWPTWAGCGSGGWRRGHRPGAARGQPVLGICGGYQMLAAEIDDPVESGAGVVAGLGLLPVRVTFGADKVLGRPSGTGYGATVPGIRDPPRRGRGRRGARGALPGRLPDRGRLGHDLARDAGERPVPASLPDRGRRARRAGLHGRTGHQLRGGPAGPAGHAGRPGRSAPGHRRGDRLIERGPPPGLPAIPPAGVR